MVTPGADEPRGGPTGESDGRKYQVLETLGRGGFGTVYRAELRGLGGFTKTVALKVLNAEVVTSPDVARRLRDEARILGLLRHRAIVQVDGLVAVSGRWAIVMEYVQGVDLGRVQTRGRVPISVALEIVGEIGSALASAWSSEGPDGRPLSLLHRDIKPSNVHLTRSGEVKVLDFGIAWADFDAREARTTSRAYGSFPYMAPERFEGVDTHAGDVYALGITFTELITGNLWQKPDLSEAGHEARLRQTCAEVRSRAQEAPKAQVDELCVLVRDMLAFDRADRPLAEEVHQRCVRLARAFGGTPLAEFARSAVPALLSSAPPPEPGELSGSLLIERDTGGALTFSLPSGSRASAPGRRGRWVGLLLGALAALALVVVTAGATGITAWTLASRPPASEPPVPVAAPLPMPVEPSPPPAPIPAPIPAPVVAPAPAPRPKPALRVEVALVGASSATLVSGGISRALPGAFAPGSYDVQADFGAGLTPAGRVTLSTGAAATVSCDPGFRLCRVVVP